MDEPRPLLRRSRQTARHSKGNSRPSAAGLRAFLGDEDSKEESARKVCEITFAEKHHLVFSLAPARRLHGAYFCLRALSEEVVGLVWFGDDEQSS